MIFSLFKDTSYFDDPYHSTGALTSNLATHASAVQGVSSLCSSLGGSGGEAAKVV
jgi:hypothetical protein